VEPITIAKFAIEVNMTGAIHASPAEEEESAPKEIIEGPW
jgi:hypothetical protein